MSKDMPGRLLRLLSLLQSRREWPGPELADRLGVSARAVRRDVDRLRGLGYPVEGTTGTAGGYRLVSGRDLPPLLLDDDEAVAIAVGLLTAADGTVAGIAESSVRALAKLERVLPARLRRRFDAVAGAVTPVARGGLPRVDPEVLAVLATACRDREMLAFAHRSRSGAVTSRRVEPYDLVSTHGLWYLLAYDPGREDWRIFRVDRITDPRPTGWRFTPRELPASGAAAHVSRSVAAAPYRHNAVATVREPAEAVRARLPNTMPGRIEPVDEHTCTVRLGSDSLDAIAAELAALGADFTLDGPPELLDRLRAVAGRLLRAAGDG
ncbi:DNA-binding transcriptional regulator [Planomonospora sphaerica]|uniref:DNA-binding transcriptional regulator n=1 Tax=Planomonospora sphaerica TaxID=161355 RepID=A0A171DN98_9ACTN|nr:YafY family protein [Planomonospora sphaerica]GAT70545.1 DNA-binding transcriptional regulator [Planomonospora sphaerica]